MVKTGRPRRRDVERDAVGRIKARAYRLSASERQAVKDSHARDAQSVAVWKRVRDMATNVACDPRLGTTLGKMLIVGDPLPIEPPLFEAGTRFAQILFVYDRLVLGKIPQVQAQNIAQQRGLSLSEPTPELVARAGYAMAKAMIALGGRLIAGDGRMLTNGVPRVAQCSLPPRAIAVEALCRESGNFGGYSPRDAVEGLQVLASHFGLLDTVTDRLRRATAAAQPCQSSSESPADDGLSHHVNIEELTQEAETL